MTNLSEEEIIKNLNNVLEKWQEIIKMEDEQEREIEMSMYFEEMPFYEIQGLLDLYQQEKEKNTALIQGQVKTLDEILQPELLKEYISKDKIREFALSESQADTYNFKTVSLDRLLKFLEEE